MKGGKMNIKKTLLTLLIVILGIAVIVGAIFGVSALMGVFDEKYIAIRNLYFENPEDATDTSIKEIEIRTLDDFKSKISYLPADATKTTLTVTTKGASNALDNFPKTVTAGEEFDIKLAKDEFGNNVGGAVELRFTDESGQALCYIRVAVDVVSTNNSIYFSNAAGSSNVSSDGITQLVMSKSGDSSKVIFKSSLANAIKMNSGFTFKTENFNNQKKKVTFDMSYIDTEGNNVSTLDWSVTDETKSSNGAIITNYIFDITPTHTGNIRIKAKMHRTYEIEEVFNESGFEEFGTVYTETSKNTNNMAFINLLSEYNAFINHYLEFFTTSETATRFFDQYYNNQGQIALTTITDVLASLEHVYVHSEIIISVVSVQLTNLSIKNSAVTYQVFDDIVYSIDALKESTDNKSFGVNIEIDNETIDDYDNEINRLFNKITMKPYMFVTIEEADNYQDVLPIVACDDDTNLPILYDSNVNTELDIQGYLVPTDKYVNVEELVEVNGDRSWRVKANLPILHDDNDEPMAQVYLLFETTSRDVDNGEIIKKNAIVEVHIDYTEYNGTIYINELKDIAINDELSDTESYALRTQEVSLNTDNISNMELVEYTKVLYFVEKRSNIEDGNPKILSSGYTLQASDNKMVYKDYNGGVYTFVDIKDGKIFLMV